MMLAGYVRGFQQPYDIIAFYSRFCTILRNGDPVAVRLVQEQGTLVHDIVIKALVERSGMLRVALDVIGDMLRDATAAAARSATFSKGNATNVTLPPLHPAPSVYTWSILLNGFLFHRQRQQAERIVYMMRAHGIEPNLVTWNTLVAGYARDQQVSKTVRALQKLEAAGYEADEFTIRAFSYLKNKEGALRKMENMLEYRRKQVEEGLETKQTTQAPAQGGIESELKRLESQADMIGKMLDDEESVPDMGGYDLDDGEGVPDSSQSVLTA
jgi:pentatricopeptide repeat protein